MKTWVLFAKAPRQTVIQCDPCQRVFCLQNPGWRTLFLKHPRWISGDSLLKRSNSTDSFPLTPSGQVSKYIPSFWTRQFEHLLRFHKNRYVKCNKKKQHQFPWLQKPWANYFLKGFPFSPPFQVTHRCNESRPVGPARVLGESRKLVLARFSEIFLWCSQYCSWLKSSTSS